GHEAVQLPFPRTGHRSHRVLHLRENRVYQRLTLNKTRNPFPAGSGRGLPLSQGGSRAVTDTLETLLGMPDDECYDIATRAAGPEGRRPLTPEMLRERPSGDLFGWTQNVGMGWAPARLGGPEVLILGTQGGIRDED